MFEAHFTKAEDFQGLETVADSWTKTYFRRHKLSFEPLRIWFAEGKRNAKNGGVQRKIFVYIEYQDAHQKHCYRTLEIAPGLSVSEALDKAIRVELNS